MTSDVYDSSASEIVLYIYSKGNSKLLNAILLGKIEIFQDVITYLKSGINLFIKIRK